MGALRNHLYWHGELYAVLAVIIGFIGLVCGIVIAVEYSNASAMRQLGYEAKVVNGTCYARYNDRWLACSAVANNQIQITK